MEQYELISEGGVTFTNNAEPISFGIGAGRIEVVRDNGTCEFLNNDTDPRLFAVESISPNLRPLLPLVKGFIFMSGNSLNHFSNTIRYSNIPACVHAKKLLWKHSQSYAILGVELMSLWTD